jgi:pimeloyl-ACP methyl ester carboxylesterase
MVLMRRRIDIDNVVVRRMAGDFLVACRSSLDGERMITRAGAVVLGLIITIGSGGRMASAQDLNRFTRTVDVNGLSFPVLDYGEGSPVLLLHGFPDDRHLWRNQVPALAAAGLRVIAPDLRGFGDAPRPQDPAEYGLDLAARDVIGMLDALRVGQVQMVGHDWGAALGWRIAALYPDRIQRYAALSVGAPGAPPTPESKEKSAYMIFFRQAGKAEEEIRRDNWKWFRDFLRGARDTERYIERLSRPGALTAGLNWYRADNRFSGLSGPPPTVACPVLGIWSDGDAYLTEEQMRTSGERIKGPFQYEKIQGASHWMMLDRPDELNRLLLRFLEREI